MTFQRTTFLFVGLILTCGLLWAFPIAQTLQVDTKLVNVFATVKNERGEFQAGLSADDFRVYEDGVEQKISVFEKDDRVQSAVLLLLDSSGSMVDVFPSIRRGTLDFMRVSPKSDDTAVMTFGRTVQVIKDFGASPKDLETRLNGVRTSGPSEFYESLLNGIRRVSTREQSRKAVIVFSDGHGDSSVVGFKDVEQAIGRTGVLLYFVPLDAKVLIDQHTLESLATLSGGSVTYLNKKDPVAPALAAIRAELSRQYYLGYYASGQPGAHSIRVDIPGRPELRIRAKSRYSG